jgi:AraC-like DNA-binding protein
MLTRNDVFQLLESFSIRRDDVVTMHSSLREIGPIEGGADGLIDALKEYLCDGLLLIPTHTWANVNAANPHFDVRSTVPCIGTLAKVAAFRKDGVRSLHPTHSMAAFGKNAREYIQGEEKSSTPGPMGGALSRLYERAALTALIADLLTSSQDTPPKSAVQNIMEYIRCNPEKDLSGNALSTIFFFHKNHINKLIKRETGKSLCEYVRYAKIEHAKTLLSEEGCSLSEISTRLGYFDYSHFYKAFYKETGITPTKYIKDANLL